GGADEAGRLAVAVGRTRRMAVALIDLPEQDQGQRKVIDLAELTVQFDGGASRLDALRLATVRQRTIGHRQVGVEARLHAEVPDALRGFEALETRGNSA